MHSSDPDTPGVDAHEPTPAVAAGPHPRRRLRRAGFALAAVFCALLFLECVGRVVLYVRPQLLSGAAVSLTERYERLSEAAGVILENRADSLAEFHANLGWRPRPHLNNGDNIIDGRGLRSEREYAEHPFTGSLRIAVFGDSFVYGSEVPNHEAWPRLLERQRPNTEVLNYGVPGYGPDQAYLRFLSEGRDPAPNIVLFGVAPPSLVRILTVSAAFRGASPDFISKPRFVLGSEGELVLMPNPLRRLADVRRYLDDPSAIRELGESDYWYEPLIFENPVFEHSHIGRLIFAGWSGVKRRFVDPERPLTGARGLGVFNETSTAFRILARILDGFVETARKWGARPIILILPDGYSVRRMRNSLPGTLDPVREYCTASGFEFVDVMDGFLAQPADELTEPWFINLYHYSTEGNLIVAAWLEHELERLVQ